MLHNKLLLVLSINIFFLIGSLSTFKTLETVLYCFKGYLLFIISFYRAQGLKYPLLVKRLACMVISGFAAADSLDILQPATLSPLMISEVRK